MYPVLQLGPLSLPLPELILIIGYWGGSILMVKANSAQLKNTGILERIIWTSLVAGIIGARLSYFARHPVSFSGEYLSLFSLNYHLFDFTGGFIIAAGTALVLAFRQNISVARLLDGLVPFHSLFNITFHLSFFFSGTAYGTPTDMPWGIFLWGTQRHPVQIYYILGALLVLYIVLVQLPKITYKKGLYITSYFSLVNLYMLFISRYQSASDTILSGFRTNQVLYLLGALAGLILFFRLISQTNNQESYVSKK
jgi:phosphatidylglycerol:prolipoprotein diacylglycerol transferase